MCKCSWTSYPHFKLTWRRLASLALQNCFLPLWPILLLSSGGSPKSKPLGTWDILYSPLLLVPSFCMSPWGWQELQFLPSNSVFIYLYGCFVCLCLCARYVPASHEVQKRALDAQELELLMTVSCHLGTASWTWLGSVRATSGTNCVTAEPLLQPPPMQIFLSTKFSPCCCCPGTIGLYILYLVWCPSKPLLSKSSFLSPQWFLQNIIHFHYVSIGVEIVSLHICLVWGEHVNISWIWIRHGIPLPTISESSCK